MKNTIKMSLAAAVAVSALTTGASAQALEDAIKGVDVSGSMVYRYDDQTNEPGAATATSASTNSYKIAISTKSKVNDNVTANVRIVTGTGTLFDNDANLANLDSQAGSDLNPNLQVSNANFAVSLGANTVIAGKQGLGTPWTVAVDSDSEEQTGTGILAVAPVGPVTLAAGYFNQTNLNANAAALTDGSDNVAVVAAMANVGPVALDGWYLDMADVFDTYTIGAKANIEGISIEARYASLDLDDSIATTDNAMMYVKVGGKVGPVGLKATYGMTDSEGGTTALDSDAKTTLTGWNMNMLGDINADLIMLNANMDIMPGLNLALNHNMETSDTAVNAVTEIDEEETYAQLTHKMGKNLVTYVRYGVFSQDTANVETADRTRGRVQVEYKF